MFVFQIFPVVNHIPPLLCLEIEWIYLRAKTILLVLHLYYIAGDYKTRTLNEMYGLIIATFLHALFQNVSF